MTIPLIVCVLGAVLYFATEGKPSEAGRWAYIIGLAFTLWAVAGVKLF